LHFRRNDRKDFTFNKAIGFKLAECLGQHFRWNINNLAKDQSDPNDYYLRGGQIGKWKSELDKVDIDLCFEFLSRFDIDTLLFIFI